MTKIINIEDNISLLQELFSSFKVSAQILKQLTKKQNKAKQNRNTEADQYLQIILMCLILPCLG